MTNQTIIILISIVTTASVIFFALRIPRKIKKFVLSLTAYKVGYADGHEQRRLLGYKEGVLNESRLSRVASAIMTTDGEPIAFNVEILPRSDT